MKRWIAVLIVSLIVIALSFGGAFAEKAYTPSENDKFDLGTDKLQYKDVRAAGSIIMEGATHNAYETTITATDPTADRTITLPNADLNLGSIGTSAIAVNTVSVTVASSGTSGTATVTSGSTILGHYGFANIDVISQNAITNASISGTTLTVLINGTAGADAIVHKVVVLEP